jgi:YegS/Rv2252/BmrU family lipid kinase
MLIVNPGADLGNAWHAAAELSPIVDEFGGADWAGTVYPTHATEIAHQAANDGYKLVIIAGGDGTIHEVLNGLMVLPKTRRPRLGIVPLGSGNDFAHAIGIDRKPANALRKVFTGSPRILDVGRMRDSLGRQKYWCNVLGVGFDAVANIHAHRMTYLRGPLLYFLAVVKTIMLNHDAPFMKVKTDLESWDQEMLMLAMCNGSREGGGFLVQPEAELDDGILHYAGIGRVSRLMMFRLLPEVMKGTHGRFSQVRMGKFTSLEISADRPLYIHADGETLTDFEMDVRELAVDILSGEIEVII